jgi:hypothetical protein|tara:strand:+ start:285 stop:425 length:141 start_codon:yes stop_codon:yes gene_type:complete
MEEIKSLKKEGRREGRREGIKRPNREGAQSNIYGRFSKSLLFCWFI